jgi:hypothetical protein
MGWVVCAHLQIFSCLHVMFTPESGGRQNGKLRSSRAGKPQDSRKLHEPRVWQCSCQTCNAIPHFSVLSLFQYPWLFFFCFFFESAAHGAHT